MPVIKLKSNAVASTVPTTGQLELGEVAINTFDGEAYYKKDDGIASIVKLLNNQDIDIDSSFTANSDTKVPSQKAVKTALDNKVDKIVGKGLSTNDFTDARVEEIDLGMGYLNDTGSSVVVDNIMAQIIPTGGINFNVTAGHGYIINGANLEKVTWGLLSSSCINGGDNFINIDATGSISITASHSDTLINIGYIRTNAANTVIIGYTSSRIVSKANYTRLGDLFRQAIGSLVESGCSTAMQASPNQLKITVSAGIAWTLLNRYTIDETFTFTKLYKTTDMDFVVDSSGTANEINVTQWNDTTQPMATALVTMTTGYYKKDLITITPEGQVFYIFGNAEYATQSEAENAVIPLVPENIKLSAIRSAAIITQKNATSVSEVIDVRPIFNRLFETGTAATNATVISHNSLTDLSDDGHTQYHNDTRGDIRYYTKSVLDGGQLDTRYYTETEINSLLNGYQPLDSVLTDISSLTLSNNDILIYNGTNIVSTTPTTYKATLGLNNVTNNLQVYNLGGARGFQLDTIANRPSASTNGNLFISSDLGIISRDNGTTWSNILPAYSGDVSSTVGGTALTLANVNSNIGTFNNITINAKGLATAGSNADYLIDSASNGILVRTALNTTTARTIDGTSNQTSVTNGDGVSGNPVISLADNPIIPGTESLTLPIGTIAQRPIHSNGMIRFNSNTLREEISESNQWRPLGRLLQFATGNITQTTGTTILPYDATLPTSTEGFQIFTTSFTPLYTTSTIVVMFNVWYECSVLNTVVSTTLLNDNTVIGASSTRQATSNQPDTLNITRHFISGTTSPINISGRIGPAAAATVYVNRGNTETFGGTISTSYIIMELY